MSTLSDLSKSTPTAPVAPVAPTPAPAATPATPAVTPPVAAPAPATPSEPPVDPLVDRLKKSFNIVVTPDAKPTDDKPVDLSKGSVSLADIISKPATATPPTPTPAPAPAAPAATPAPEPELPKKVVVKPVEPPEPAPVAPAPVAIPPAPTPAPENPDAEFVASLNEAQRDELELAQYAEAKDTAFKGQAKKTVDYFKALEKFNTDNPDATPDEQDEFIAKNKPKFNESQRRRLERQMITDAASESAKREMAGKSAELEQQLHALRVKPDVEAASKEFKQGLETLDLPPELTAVKEVAAMINKDGYDAAAKEFSLEAPILKRHSDVAEVYIGISRGATRFNPADPNHQWLDAFVTNQATKLMQSPEAKVGNKMFLPPGEYATKRAADPTGTARNHWTFSEKQILNMIAVNGALMANAELQRAKQNAEYIDKRFKKSATTEIPKPETKLPVTENPSPRAGGSPTPGPVAAPATPLTPEAAFLERLMPGASKIVSGK